MKTVRFWTGTLVLSLACGLVIFATSPGYQIGSSGRVRGHVTRNGRPLADAMVVFVSEDPARCEDSFAYTDKNGDYAVHADWRREGPSQTRFKISVIPDAARARPRDSARSREHQDAAEEVRRRNERQAASRRDGLKASGPSKSAAAGRESAPPPKPPVFSSPFTTDLSVLLGPEPARIDIDLED